MSRKIFINRRSGKDRRSNIEQRVNPRLDLSYRKRRKTTDRRMPKRQLSDDFYASCDAVYDAIPSEHDRH